MSKIGIVYAKEVPMGRGIFVLHPLVKLPDDKIL